jgi:hypothetical protein
MLHHFLAFDFQKISKSSPSPRLLVHMLNSGVATFELIWFCVVFVVVVAVVLYSSHICVLYTI